MKTPEEIAEATVRQYMCWTPGAHCPLCGEGPQ